LEDLEYIAEVASTTFTQLILSIFSLTAPVPIHNRNLKTVSVKVSMMYFKNPFLVLYRRKSYGFWTT